MGTPPVSLVLILPKRTLQMATWCRRVIGADQCIHANDKSLGGEMVSQVMQTKW